MSVLIQELIDIDQKDNFEIVVAQIASIIAAESESQQALAVAQSVDPEPYKLLVYLERSNPWERYQRSRTDQTPIVNVYYDNDVTDLSSSNMVKRQKMNGVFIIDCYGHGISRPVDGGGHIAGDQEAAQLAQQTMRVVRKYLFAGVHQDLGLTGIVWRRWVESREILQQQSQDRPTEQIVAGRIRMRVEYNEFSPQYIAETLSLLSVDVNVAPDGELYFDAQYVYP